MIIEKMTTKKSCKDCDYEEVGFGFSICKICNYTIWESTVSIRNHWDKDIE